MIAPPYDVISPEEQTALYERSPYNCVRLILNRIEKTDTEAENRYTRARQCFESWKKEGVLVREEKPAFYLYHQRFTDPARGKDFERTAIFGVIQLESFEKGGVVPHERTLAKPCEDRRRLLEATGTNFSPVFGLFEDHEGFFAEGKKYWFKARPMAEAQDEQKVHHRVWALTEPDATEKIRKAIGRSKIYIADGHHRYQTALNYAQAQRKRLKAGEETQLPSDFALMALVEFQDPGLVIYPTHRLIRRSALLPSGGEENLLEPLRRFFSVEPSDFSSLEKETLASRDSAPLALGLLLGERAFRLTLKDPAGAQALMPPGKADAWYALDVSLVSYLILAKLWNIPEKEWEGLIEYTHATRDVCQAMYHAREHAAAFLLKPPGVGILKKMGEARELMPQKSTYFYPKLASGIVFYEHRSSMLLK